MQIVFLRFFLSTIPLPSPSPPAHSKNITRWYRSRFRLCACITTNISKTILMLQRSDSFQRVWLYQNVCTIFSLDSLHWQLRRRQRRFCELHFVKLMWFLKNHMTFSNTKSASRYSRVLLALIYTMNCLNKFWEIAMRFRRRRLQMWAKIGQQAIFLELVSNISTCSFLRSRSLLTLLQFLILVLREQPQPVIPCWRVGVTLRTLFPTSSRQKRSC